MQRRRQLLDELIRSVASDDASRPLTALFRLLYGLPASVQLAAASFALHRYLPTFEHRWPELTWSRELLHDVDSWLRRYNRSLPEEPADPGPADAAFRFGLDALLLAASNTGDPAVLTSSCCAAVGAAIDAHRYDAWSASDPEAVALWNKLGEMTDQVFDSAVLEALAGRGVFDNLDARAAAQREWLVICQWLEEQQVFTYPEPEDLEQVEQDLARWKEREMLLLVPLPPGI